jgi:hypothetical protein
MCARANATYSSHAFPVSGLSPAAAADTTPNSNSANEFALPRNIFPLPPQMQPSCQTIRETPGIY